MKKNDRQLKDNLNKNYILTFPDIKQIEEKDADTADLGDYFGETAISIYFAIPDPESRNDFFGLKISYPLRIQLTEENKYDITHDDLTFCNLIIYKRHNPIDFKNATLYSSLVTESKFSNFVSDCSETIDEYFQQINHQSFFDFKVRKNKVLLNQSLIKYVQKRICSCLNKTVELLEKADDDSLFEIYKGSSLEMDRLEGLSFAIKQAEKQFEYTQLKLDLGKQLDTELNNQQDKLFNKNRKVKI